MTRARAIFLVLFGATLMSFVGIILRHIEAADGFQIMAYRSLALCAIVLAFGCWHRRQSALDFVSGIDRKDHVVGLLLGLAFTAYVFALINTNVASALFILACAPVFATTLAWLVLGEAPSPVSIAAIVMAIGGVSLMVWDGLGNGGTLGNLFAMLSAFCFACMLVLIRKFDRDPLGGTFMAGIFSSAGNAAVALVIGEGLAISNWDLGLSLFMGAFTIGLGIACVTLAANQLPASEVSILVLFESVLGPVWVWLFLNETATLNVLLGGLIVLVAVIIQTWGSRKRGRAAFSAT
ncbi:MAG: DMT family transporter [Pseudomonadota bacterium]